LVSISASELASEILDACLRDGTWPAKVLDALIDRALDEDDIFTARAATRAFFGILIERLGDLFEPALCEVYARLFAHVIELAFPEYDAHELLVRYRRIRQVHRFVGGEIQRVFVLSRVTLGADIVVTSMMLDAAKKRFPGAEICFVGPEKNAALFAGDKSITAIPVAYGRSSLLRERLTAAIELRSIVEETSSLVIDPDSRLTQLGLIPVCDDSRYYFFESRAFGGDLDSTLPQLTSEWLAEVFDVQDATRYVAPVPVERIAPVTVSFGVGENANKRLEGDFEYNVLAALLERFDSVLLDQGAGGEEAERARELHRRVSDPARVKLHEGSYASFASHILQSKLYLGYDSAGQHVADAGGVPLVSVFAGFPCDRMFSRWRPSGPASHVVKIDESNRASALDLTIEAIAAAGAEARATSTGRMT
jgi:ADP-heptose:LPS heptosyltransferase